ncbi:MAG: nucleotidyltransferase family protein [Symploca sp. SIO3C6]|uniref:Nucleotidyltransferase family protein n=1 Tax=Symploca sp. SIO1C4 TaxID=2607765 RepID=A0A6B3NPW7_9CYAN|nr:nucleotidyltransferase family protein [Symploca sp. SIO3C6]NER31278.1 nucleotidyltransferase family protein [Symploca sp. SIO1C4]
MKAIPKFVVKPGYSPQAEDISVETDLLIFHLLRKRTSVERLSMAASLTRSARKLSLCSLSQQFGHLSPTQFAQKIALAWLQEYCPANYIPSGDSSMWIQDSVSLAVKLHPIFEELGISYYVTGGVAAISYGEPRTTQDLDLVISISPLDIDRLVNALSQAGFYVPGVNEVKSGRIRTLQITDIESISRADLVLAGTDEFERLKFERRRVIEFEDTALYFASPEDLILNKLCWRQYSSSEKQWRDVLGVLKVQTENLDFDYLRQWAEQLGITDALNQVMTEAGIKK